ncbi:MAG TPA: hypothetical protein VF487_16395 [Chitinophagaceae bacterium]
MQIAKQTSIVKLTFYLLVLFTVMAVVFSCSKDKTAAIIKDEDVIAGISSHASNRTSTVAVPYENTIYVPCANGGAGEYVQLNGYTNFLYTISWTDQGFTYGYHANYHQIKGVGLSSGQTFVASGNTEGQVAASWLNERWVAIIKDQLRVISSNTSFVIKNTYHAVTTPGGDVIMNLRENEVKCN